jgi:hypothetical protein
VYLAFLIIGKILAFIGWAWIVVLAWQRGVIWGAACIAFPFVELFYVGRYWKETKQPFFFLLTGFAVIALATLVGHS